MISSPLMESAYERAVPDYAVHVGRTIDAVG
jgi:hypothetical protein